MKLTTLFPLIIIFALSACASSPTHVVISPELFGYTKNVYIDKAIQLNIIDHRPATHVVQITKDDRPAKLFSSQGTLTSIIEQALTPALSKQGLTLNTTAQIQLNIYINNALINVTQNFIDYHVNNSITLTVKLENTSTLISKTFGSKGKSHGPLVADMAVLERDFNHQLAAVLIKMTNSVEIQNAINSHSSL